MAVDAITAALLKDAQLGNPIVLASSAAPVVNSDYTNYVDITALAVGTNLSTGLSGSPVDGQSLTYRILDNGTTRAVTFGASILDYRGAGTATTVYNTTAGKRGTIQARYDSTAAKWGIIGITTE